MKNYRCVCNVKTPNGMILFKQGRIYRVLFQDNRYMFFWPENRIREELYISLKQEHMDVYFTSQFKYGK